MYEKYVSRIILDFESKTEARNIYLVLYPETVKVPSHRSRYELLLEEKTLVITIYSKDLSSFRAAVNTMLRLLQTLEPLIMEKTI